MDYERFKKGGNKLHQISNIIFRVCALFFSDALYKNNTNKYPKHPTSVRVLFIKIYLKGCKYNAVELYKRAKQSKTVNVKTRYFMLS